MKKLFLLLIGFSMVMLSACNNERQVNGRSLKSAFRSVKTMKEYLPKELKLEFQIAFWTLRNGISEKEEFLDAVDGKTAKEIIASGKEKFEQMQTSDYAYYQNFGDWDDMIAQDREIRAQQDLGIDKKNQRMQRDRSNNVMYDLH